LSKAARAAGRWAGVFCAHPQVARQVIELGYHMVTPGNDIGILRQGVAERIAIARGVTPKEYEARPHDDA
jgi:4-hydroxy-2-oxoheptanedioate aldolase